MNRTIAYVKPNVRDWTSAYGPMKSIDGGFDDGDGWTINCKPGNETKLKDELESLVGKPLDGFTVEVPIDKKTGQQREYNGKLQWSLKQLQQAQGGFRGGGGGGGGSKWTEAYSQSKEAHEVTQRSIQRNQALTLAITTLGGPTMTVDPMEALRIAALYLPFLSDVGTAPVAGPSKDYEQWITWMEESVKARGVINKPTLWKAAMTFANQQGYDHEQLKNCTDRNVFETIKNKLKAFTVPPAKNDAVNAYSRQPVAAAPKDDDLPF